MADYSISVVIPAYNSEKYIGRAIESVLKQNYKVFEIIVVDDGSTDNTREVVAEFGDKVRYIYQENKGPSNSRNTGVLAAKGEWISFLDSDDEWLENRLYEQVCVLKRNPELQWLSGNFITCLCVSGRKLPYTPVQKFAHLLDGCDSMVYYDAAVKGISGCMDTMLIKRDMIIEAGLFCPEYKLGEDLDLWWRIACRCPVIGLVAQPLAIYHMQVGGSITKSRFPAELYAGLIERNIKIAAEFGKQAEFNKMAAFMLKRWLRSMLFHKDRKADVLFLLNRHKRILPVWFCVCVYLAAICPAFTQIVLRGISRVSRRFGLRRRLVPPPVKMDKS